MEAGKRVNLEMLQISTLPRRDTQRAVLDFVKSLRSFSKVHATEGKAYLASWDDKEALLSPVIPKTRTSQSCGFATPVLKPRIPPALKEDSTEGVIQTRDRTSPKNSTRHSTTFIHVKENTTAKTVMKPTGAGRSKETVTRRRSNRKLQSDEEKRLQERRERKRTRRDIMQPNTSQTRKPNDDASDDRSKGKSKSKLPAGLALMYGFTATNVGKNRLTVDPPFRSGVFGKGKASIQTRVGQFKLKSTTLAFSEEQFLTSAEARQRGGRQATSSASHSSQISSETTDNEGLRRQKRRDSKPAPKRLRAELPEPEVLPDDPQKRKGPRTESRKTRKRKRSCSPSEDAQSIVWDIEKDSGILPTDSSSVVSRGPEPSTIVLNVAQKQWVPDPPSLRGEQVSCAQDLTTSRETAADGGVTRVLEPSDKGQNTPSFVSSVRPSESPSQVAPVHEIGLENQQAMVSKYFPSAQSHPTQRVTEPSLPTVIPQSPAGELREFTVLNLREKTSEPLQLSTECEDIPVLPENNGMVEDAENFRKGRTGSDWLFSDLDSVPNNAGDWGAELFPIQESSEVQLECEEGSHDESIGRQEEFYLYEEPLDKEQRDFSTGADVVFLDNLHFFPESYDDEIFLPQLGVEEPTRIETARSDNFQESDNDPDVDNLNKLVSLSDHLSFSSIDLASEISLDPSEEATPAAKGRLLQFNEGRFLLYASPAGSWNAQYSSLVSIEADVARRLVGHWAPHKY